MTREVLLAALAALASCEVDHHVRLLLGPNEDTISSGFTCHDPDAPANLLVERAYDPATGTFAGTLVVDVVDLGGVFPSCLAEDIEASCGSASCQLLVADAPTRFCDDTLRVPISDLADAPRELEAYLDAHYPTVIADAPHRPVILRVVITQQACADIQVQTAGAWAPLDPASVLGCAYSCPLSLDDANGTISVGLDTTLAGSSATACQEAVDVCAEFPAKPQL